MLFRTELIAEPSPIKIRNGSGVFLMGSCFSEEIGAFFRRYKFQANVNPFGTVYNPLSIAHLLNPAFLFNKHLVHDGKNWVSLDAHASFSNKDKDLLLEALTNAKKQTIQYIEQAERVIITWGTAWVYEFMETGEVVANCQKLSGNRFKKRLLSLDEITQSFDRLYARLLKINPTLRIILTLSPVRHLKDTIPLNSVSKGLMRYAIHQIVQKYERVDYFPAYELLTDDLRDYRFYKEDLIHPNAMGVKYVWDKFCVTYFDSATLKFIEEWESILKDLEHRPLQSDGMDYNRFLLKVREKLVTVSANTNVQAELEWVEAKMKSV